MTEFNTTIVTPPVTGYFVHVVNPAPPNQLRDYEAYTIQVILDKKEHEAFVPECQEAIKQAGKAGVAKGLFPEAALASLAQPLRDGDAEIADITKKRGPEYANKIFFNANSIKAPGVIHVEGGRDIIDPDECYSGALYRVQVTFYPTNKGGPKVAAGLQNVMKVGEGIRMDGRMEAKKAFDGMIEEGQSTPQNDETAGSPDMGFQEGGVGASKEADEVYWDNVNTQKTKAIEDDDDVAF